MNICIYMLIHRLYLGPEFKDQLFTLDGQSKSVTLGKSEVRWEAAMNKLIYSWKPQTKISQLVVRPP